MTIHRHVVDESTGVHYFETEKGARIIDAGINYIDGVLDVWSENNEQVDGVPRIEREVFVAWTGGEAPSGYHHLRTMRCVKTGIVWHVYVKPLKFTITGNGDVEFRVEDLGRALS